VPFDDNPQDSNISMLKWMKVVKANQWKVAVRSRDSDEEESQSRDINQEMNRSSGTANSRQSFGTSGWNMSRNKDETVATVDGDAKSMEEKGIATTFEIELVVVESNDETVATVDSGSIDENVIATTSETESAVVESDNETVATVDAGSIDENVIASASKTESAVAESDDETIATVDAGSIDENVINKTRQSILFQN